MTPRPDRLSPEDHAAVMAAARHRASQLHHAAVASLWVALGRGLVWAGVRLSAQVRRAAAAWGPASPPRSRSS
jgi:hypothetical protein